MESASRASGTEGGRRPDASPRDVAAPAGGAAQPHGALIPGREPALAADAGESGAPSWRARLLVVLGLVAGTLAIYAQTLRHPFFNLDDPDYVVERPLVARGFSAEGLRWAFTGVHSANWHPLTTLSHMLDAELHGLAPAGHHATSVLLQAAAAAGLFLALVRLTGALRRSALVAALFAFHPLRVESVAWISERKDVLSGVFFVLALGAYARHAAAPSPRRMALVALAFALGLLAKPMLVTLPAVLFLLDVWPLGRLARGESPRRLVVEKLPLLALSAASCIATLLAQRGAISTLDAIPLSTRLANAVVSCAVYLRQLVWPAGLAPFYPLAVEGPPGGAVALSALVVLAISALAWRARRTRPWLLVGWLWYLVMLLPVIGLVQVGSQAHADRYTYLPAIGVLLALLWSVAELGPVRRLRASAAGRRALGAACAAVCLGSLALARAQAALWKDDRTLWTATLERTGVNPLAHRLLGALDLQDGRLEESVRHLEIALADKPEVASLHVALASALERLGRYAGAIEHYGVAQALEPDAAAAANNLAWLLATCPLDALRDGPRAVQLAEACARAGGYGDANALDTLAAAHAEAGAFDRALAWQRKALALASDAERAPLAERLALYEAGLPYRTSAPAASDG